MWCIKDNRLTFVSLLSVFIKFYDICQLGGGYFVMCLYLKELKIYCKIYNF